MTKLNKSQVGKSFVHESAHLHVSGSAEYIDDMPAPDNTLHIAFATSKIACGDIKNIDIRPALKVKGVEQVYLADDIKHLLIGPIAHDEPLIAKDKILFYGQSIAVVVANDIDIARRAAKLIKLDAKELKPIITTADAMAAKSFLHDPLVIQTGDAQTAIKQAEHQLAGKFLVGGQEHFYLESQTALAIPKDGNEVLIYSSTQNPTEVQHLVSHVLEIPQNAVEVVTRRMGGAFGGKESDSSQIACLSALIAKKLGRAVKARLPRFEDMLMTGKRHDFAIEYQVGFDKSGKIDGVNIDFMARCGYSLDLSTAIVSRTLFHADNTYYLPNAKFTGHLCKTNTVSNTAFRGFGGPQGMLAIENIIEEIAHFLKVDSLEIRKINFYQKTNNNITPYGQTIEDNIVQELIDELELSTGYQNRREAVNKFNQEHRHLKKGLALLPIKFGISFTTQFLNQAGASVHVYKDGSIYLNHGGTEMGQGLFIKIAQVVADEFGVPLTAVKVSATNTTKVPNTSPTAASSGSDLNGMAAKIACGRIKANLINFATEHYSIKADTIAFKDNQVILGNKTIAFKDFINTAFLNRVELFSNGFYKTPKIYYDHEKAKGRPFFYYSYGAGLSEVVIDCLTGEYKVTAVDILHDVGASINPAIDTGQIVGGFIQGMGWLTAEQLKWNDNGALLTTGAATYKIPAIGDTPQHFNVKIKPNHSNHENTIHKSKAVGEPPFMLAISIWLAIKNAIYNAQGTANELNAPANFEEVFFKLNKF